MSGIRKPQREEAPGPPPSSTDSQRSHDAARVWPTMMPGDAGHRRVEPLPWAGSVEIPPPRQRTRLGPVRRESSPAQWTRRSKEAKQSPKNYSWSCLLSRDRATEAHIRLPQAGHISRPISKHVSQSRHRARRPNGRCSVLPVAQPLMALMLFRCASWPNGYARRVRWPPVRIGYWREPYR
jgi:hypothetical protein